MHAKHWKIAPATSADLARFRRRLRFWEALAASAMRFQERFRELFEPLLRFLLRISASVARRLQERLRRHESEKYASYPVLLPGGVPPDEREATRHLNHTLSEIGGVVNDFRRTLRLFDLSERRFQEAIIEMRPHHRSPRLPGRALVIGKMKDAGHWCEVAAKDAAMQIHSFALCLDELFAVLSSCPTVRSMFNERGLRAAAKLFHRSFPNSHAIRHGIAHAPELMIKKSWGPDHQFSGYRGKANIFNPDANVTGLIISFLRGRILTCTWKKQIIELEVTNETAVILERIRDDIYAVFTPVAESLRTRILARGRSKHDRSNGSPPPAD